MPAPGGDRPRGQPRRHEAALAASIAAIHGCRLYRQRSPHIGMRPLPTLWLAGRNATRAQELMSTIVIEEPRDIIALAAAHALDFQARQSRHAARPRRSGCSTTWDGAMQGYAAVLAMYAFGLEENAAPIVASETPRPPAPSRAEPGACARRSTRSPMSWRWKGGQRGVSIFSTALKRHGADESGFSIHLAWHRALFHLRFERARRRAGGLRPSKSPTPAVTDPSQRSPTLPGFAVAARAFGTSSSAHDGSTLADRWEKAPLRRTPEPFFPRACDDGTSPPPGANPRPTRFLTKA